MSLRFLLSAAAIAAAVSCPQAVAQETGTLKAQFVYAGAALDPAAIVVDKDKEFCGKFDLVNERLQVNKSGNGIKNMLFYVYTGTGGSKLSPMPGTAKTVVLANNSCRFEPHVVLLQVGDTLEITNPDTVGHNANVNFFKNRAENPLIPPGASVKFEIKQAEPGVTKVDCNIHPWMTAQVVALDHPFAAVSDEDGMVEITGLPVGKLAFRINHEAATGSFKEIMIDGKPTSLKKNVIEVDIKAGVNDLGKITMPADSLAP